MNEPTLAQRLGTTTHLLGLLQKARRLGLGAEELRMLAIQRGCGYYHNGEPITIPEVTALQFSNAELAIALLNLALPYDPRSLRLGAAMLSAADDTPDETAWLAKLERSEVVVRYVAECGKKFEPDNEFWSRLLALLPDTPPPKTGVFPHPTRFVEMTGIDRGKVGTFTTWIRPRRLVAA